MGVCVSNKIMGFAILAHKAGWIMSIDHQFCLAVRKGKAAHRRNSSINQVMTVYRQFAVLSIDCRGNDVR